MHFVPCSVLTRLSRSQLLDPNFLIVLLRCCLWNIIYGVCRKLLTFDGLIHIVQGDIALWHVANLRQLG